MARDNNNFVRDLGVSIYNMDTGKLDRKYENIYNYDDAMLLAQLAMSEKLPNELVVIMPGWNLGIKKNNELYKKALVLAEKKKI